MGTGTFAAVLIIGILLLLLISIFLRQKNKDETNIRRKVRSTLIEETTGVSVNERLKAKRESISRPENVDFCELRSAKKLDLPERVDGWLDLSGLTTVEGLKLPKRVGRGLDLKGLTTAEGLEFPEYVGGWLDLRGLTTSRGLKLPEHVSGDIYFGSLPKSQYGRLSHGLFRMDGKVRFEPLVDEDQIMRMRLRAARGGAVTRSTTRHMRAGMGSATSSPRIVLRRSPLDSRRAEPFPEL